MKLTRRTLLSLAGASAASALLPVRAALAQDRRIRHFWWGNPTRDERTFKLIEQFQAANAGINVSGEAIGWGDYWTKMATQTAGGNMADVVQMDHGYITEYVSRGAILPLDDLVGTGIKLDHYDAGANDVGTIDGKLFGISIGSTSQAIPYNQRILEEAGVEFDPLTWTTDDFAAACARITEHTGGKVTGSEDLSLYVENFEVWCRQAGVDMYDAEGKLAVTEEILRGYWEFWGELRKAGVVEGPDATVRLDKGMSELGIVTGTSAMTFRYANQVGAVQTLMTDPVGVAMVPHRAGMAYGHFVLPSMFLAMTRDAKDKEAVAAYISYWITSPDAIMTLGLDRGIPPSALGREALQPAMSEGDQRVVAYFGAIQDKIGPTPTRKPKGAGEVRDSFMRTGTDVVLGYLGADEAAGRFVQDAQDILDRAR